MEVFTTIALLLLLNHQISTTNCQLISHFNAKGLRGNISFQVETSDNLVIRATLEPILLGKARIEYENLDKTRPILFDWSLHSNSLQPDMLTSCTNDHLGPAIWMSDKFKLAEGKPIVLDKPNEWTYPLREFLQSNSMPNLAALLWGKSVRIKLSTSHQPPQATQPPASSSPQAPTTNIKPPSLLSLPKLQPAKSPSSGQNSSSNPIPPRASQTFSSGLNRPQLAAGPYSTPAPGPPQGKPTFAPRAKPRLGGGNSQQAKPQPTTIVVQPSSLPKPLALVLEPLPISAVQNTSVDAVEVNNNKRIGKLFAKSLICGTIIDTRNVKSLEAVFESQVGGKVTLRGAADDNDVTLIMAHLYHIKSKVNTRHEWRLLASDILDNRRHGDECKYLETVFDPNNVNDADCGRGGAGNHSSCKMGDLVGKHGLVQVAGLGKSLPASRQALVDLNLPISYLEGSRSLFIVLYEVAPLLPTAASSKQQQHQNIVSCAQLRPLQGRKLEALINMDGVRGSIKLSQRHSHEPTTISYDLFGLEGNVRHQSIRELPLAPRLSADNSKLCGQLGTIFNPANQQEQLVYGTVDAFPVGNLSAKHGQLAVIDSEYEDHYMGEFQDLTVQLFGPASVVGRSLVLHKNNGDPWTCGTLNHVEQRVKLAAAIFHYPVVGKISFQQLEDEPHAETGVLVEVYNPNGERDSHQHNWLVHLQPAMADFYNWSQRCASSGEVFDPLQASPAAGQQDQQYARLCQSALAADEPLRCRSGDTSLKAGFKLSLPLSHLNRSRHYYLDPYLPLSNKQNSIIGRSLVIYDEQAPAQRGNRLACSTIRALHPLKAQIRSWSSGPSIPSAVTGRVQFEQTTSSSPTQIQLDLSGFNGNVEHYAIHQVWTQEDREFPCSNDSLYDIYDPYDSENSQRLPPSAHYGSLATVDRVKVGDMSRKHGSLEALQAVKRWHLDANLPLFAPRSIVGRSMVLRAAVNDFRWVCGNIELDYDGRESREIVAVASFDEPRSKVAGFVKFTQLEHKDGSLSDTFVQVDLKLQSDTSHEPQTSADHNWAIFVNQVGEDAFIAAEDVRCIASGFKWNPYLVQDNLESYATSCNPGEQLACAMGDLGQRHGPLTLGPNHRRTVSDSNLPLAGNYSVMGRSLIIFDNKRSNHKLACANIFPDIHLKSNVVIKRTPSFTVARFVEQMRTLLGAADWLIVPELRATKPVANGECIQMTIHFYGQRAHQLQIELNNLITLGTVRKSTRVGVDKISTHYKLCRVGESNQQNQLLSSAPGSRSLEHPVVLLLVIFLSLLYGNLNY